MSVEQANVPNLDALSESKLQEFWQRHQRGQFSRELFPLGGPRTRVATYELANYAMNKAVAMQCRVDGNVAVAIDYEAICDRIYAELPEWARW